MVRLPDRAAESAFPLVSLGNERQCADSSRALRTSVIARATGPNGRRSAARAITRSIATIGAGAAWSGHAAAGIDDAIVLPVKQASGKVRNADCLSAGAVAISSRGGRRCKCAMTASAFEGIRERSTISTASPYWTRKSSPRWLVGTQSADDTCANIVARCGASRSRWKPSSRGALNRVRHRLAFRSSRR